ncbi:receptor-type tyrosine-protein phosphatase eta-like [Sardina pilchardus]|uniref:receptor-type tyrosine-protein phosphatase eta-like n=1 Tax=Sardina pilchardus TaxID=27697 RepID=UPI002E110CAB
MENSDDFSYTVTISNSSLPREFNTQITSQDLTDLIPGTYYNISVRTTGPLGFQSERVVKNALTRPETVQPLISNQSNNSITVSWNAPDGNVEFYEVLLNSSSNSSSSVLLNSSHSSYEFQNLTAGKIYTATVLTKSGIFSEKSEQVTNATYPNPPGSINITNTTTNSISIVWAPAPWMENSDDFSYTVTISNSSLPREFNTQITSQDLTDLTPGRYYSISVRTTGPLGFQSERVVKNALTRPETVQPLISNQSNNSITVSWDAPNGRVEFYEVLLNSSSNSSSSGLLDSSARSHMFQNLTAGKIYTATVLTKSGNFSEESKQVTSATYPNPPGSININNTTTNSISIVWAPAPWMENSDDFNYTVTISNSSSPREFNTKITSQDLTDLTPGTFYNISVRTTGPLGFQSERVVKNAFTRPETVQPFISNQSNNSITVSWNAPDGNVESYVVLLNSSSSSSSSVPLDSSARSHMFQNLTAGKIYKATVITQSGRFRQESEPVTNATYPNPPGSININNTTTNSISIVWAPAPWMENSDDFNYTVTISNSSSPREFNTKITSQDLTDLTPGTFYNISVRTTGPLGFQSERVVKNAFTRPETVQPFISNQSNNSITVSWNAPDGNVESYVVLLNSSSSSSSSVPLDSSARSHMFQSLAAGKIYKATVITQSGIFRQESEPVTNATYPNPPGSININNTTTNSISIVWAPAPWMENSDDFNYTVTISNSSLPREFNTKITSQDLTDLTPGTFYNISVRTTGPLGFQSERVVKNAFTRPETVQPFISNQSNNSITVSWNSPDGNVESYVVLLNSSSSSSSSVPLDSSARSHMFQSLAAGKIYKATVITQSGIFRQESEPVTNATYPNPPGSININNTTTNSISIVWAPAPWMENSDDFNYTVTISNSSLPREFNTKITSQDLTDLTPGTFYNISVRTTGPLGFQSERVVKNAFTRPETVQPFISNQSNNSITVSWNAPDGNVESYVVLLNSSSSSSSSVPLDSSARSHMFQSLAAGKIYKATVITQSGIFRQESEPVTNATYPNPPGSININNTTTNSISIVWAPAPWMENSDDFNYTVTISNSSLPREFNTKITSQDLTDLTPGTFYNISVRTTGPLGFQSERVVKNAFTRPETVQPFISNQSNNSITVSWNAPDGNVESYVVLLNSSSSSSSSVPLDSSARSHMFQSLAAGKIYKATVITQSGIFSEKSEQVTNATYPNPPGSININNTTTNSISIVWAPAPWMENSDDFNYTVTISNSPLPREFNTKITSQDLTDLTPGTFYNISVRTTGPLDFQSERVVKNAFTRPETVQPFISNQSNNSITVSWNAPDGNVESYVVLLNSSSSSSSSVPLDSSARSHMFQSLAAGKIYKATVITQSGIFRQESEPVTNATYPNPPGSININNTTTNSISIVWAPAPWMENSDDFNYTVTISNSPLPREFHTKITSQDLTDLTPGTFYNISVRTTGPLGFQSERVVKNAFTNTMGLTEDELECHAPNRSTNPLLNLRWKNPKGSNTGFEITVKNKKFVVYDEHQDTCNKECELNLTTHLAYDTEYSVTVRTKGNGEREKWGHVTKTCKTGVTEPPVVTGKDKIDIKVISHNQILLSLDPSFLDSSKGLIRDYGVLVSQRNNPNFTSTFLRKSYSDWEKNKDLSYLSVLNHNGNTRSQMDRIDIHVGSGDGREKYRNGPLTPTKTYSFAIVTFTCLEITDGLVDIDQSIYSISITSSWSASVPQDKLVIITAVGTTCGILILCLCVAIAVLIFLKRRGSGRPSSDIPINIISSVPVRIEEFDAYYKRQCANSKCGFAEEYEDLKPVGTAQSTATARALENKAKNRYSNVLPYEPSRVKLSILGSQFDDYINANYIPGANSRKEFIACQGPLPATVNDFWRMIWEKNVRSIVMLTRCNEQGRVKCEQYWPPENKHYNNIIVTTTSEITLDDWTLRDFDVKNVKTAETRAVRQFHYTAWPDHGVPVTTELLINFRHLVREHMDQYSLHSPTVVHCSAGVGRTGTFIAIDRIIFQIERESIVDVFGIVYDMRMHRALMVQTEDQYVFLNQCALDVIKSRMGTNVDLIYQNTEAINIYENVKPGKL